MIKDHSFGMVSSGAGYVQRKLVAMSYVRNPSYSTSAGQCTLLNLTNKGL